jgi:hypothetical protein
MLDVVDTIGLYDSTHMPSVTEICEHRTIQAPKADYKYAATSGGADEGDESKGRRAG